MKTDKTNRLELIPVQAALINDIHTDSLSPSMRVNCATLARLFNVSRTSIKRYVDAGKIQLDANGLACPKQSAAKILESATSNRVKAKFFKTEMDTRSAIETENDLLKKKLHDAQTKLTEAQTELKQLKDWDELSGDDYFALDDAITAFIDALVNDDDLKTAVFEGNRAILQNAFDDLLEFEND